MHNAQCTYNNIFQKLDHDMYINDENIICFFLRFIESKIIKMIFVYDRIVV